MHPWTYQENFAAISLNVLDSDLLHLASSQNDAMRRRFSTKNSKIAYKHNKLVYLSTYIFYLVWLYFILSAGYLGIVLVGPRAKTFSPYYKIGVLLTLVLFPYLATPVEMFFLKMFTYIIETLIGHVYERPDFEYIIDYNAIPNLFSY